MTLNWDFSRKATKLILILQNYKIKKDSKALLESSEHKHLSSWSLWQVNLSTEGVSLFAGQHQLCLLPKTPWKDRNCELKTQQQPGPGCWVFILLHTRVSLLEMQLCFGGKKPFLATSLPGFYLPEGRNHTRKRILPLFHRRMANFLTWHHWPHQEGFPGNQKGTFGMKMGIWGEGNAVLAKPPACLAFFGAPDFHLAHFPPISVPRNPSNKGKVKGKVSFSLETLCRVKSAFSSPPASKFLVFLLQKGRQRCIPFHAGSSTALFLQKINQLTALHNSLWLP